MDDVPDFAASQAVIPAAAAPVAWALVEIFGHRSHYGEIREVEAFGAKMLEVIDADTGKIHRYGGASVFSLTMLTQTEMDTHLASVQRQKDCDAKWKAECEQRRLARDAASDVDDDDERPF